MPTVATTNIGLAVVQKVASLMQALVSSPFLCCSAISFAPTGYPQISDKTISQSVFLGAENSLLDRLVLPKINSIPPDFDAIPLASINGKIVGNTLFAQIDTPFTKTAEYCCTSQKNIAITAMQIALIKILSLVDILYCTFTRLVLCC